MGQKKSARASDAESRADGVMSTPPPTGSDQPPTDGLPTISHLAVAAVCGVLAFGIFVDTAYESLAGGDSGELLATACLRGVAHPPG